MVPEEDLGPEWEPLRWGECTAIRVDILYRESAKSGSIYFEDNSVTFLI